MNREAVAKELLAVARDLTAASDIDLMPEYRDMFKKVARKVQAAVKSAKGVDKAEVSIDTIGSGLVYFKVNATGYTKGDLEAEAVVFVSIGLRDGKNLIWVEGKRPDWGKYFEKIYTDKFDTVIPMGTIVAQVETIFG